MIWTNLADSDAAEVRVEPQESLVDELPSVRLVDAPTDKPICLTVETVDAAGHRRRSSTLAGGEDASEPRWAMEFFSNDVAPVDFAPPRDRLDYKVHAEAAGAIAKTTATRIWGAGPPPLASRSPGCPCAGSGSCRRCCGTSSLALSIVIPHRKCSTCARLRGRPR